MSSARLNPFPAVEVDRVRFLVDAERPVAVLQSGGSSRWVTWPNAPLPPAAATARLVSAPDAVWVVYEEAIEGNSDIPSCTAVRIGVDGVASGVVIGRLQVIGADSEGIWATPQSSPTPERYPGESEDSAEPAGFGNADDADLPLESWDEFQRNEEQWRAQESFGWLQYDTDDEGRTPHFETPPAPGPSSPVELTRFRIDGRTDTLKVDRTVAGVEQDGLLTTVTYFPTNPIATVGQGGNVLNYSYPTSRIAVDFSSGLPSTLAVGEYAATELPLTDEWEDTWDDESISEEPDIRVDDRVDVASLVGIDWAPAEISPEEVQVAVSSLVEKLEALAEPHSIWTIRDEQVHRVESPYRDLSVRVEGTWPATIVSVEFRHREYSDALYRRRYRVFDSSGRPIDRTYLTVYLEEDIATYDHPDERDGIIDFLDD